MQDPYAASAHISKLTMSIDEGDMMSVIRVFIDEHCLGCQRAQELVEQVQASDLSADIGAVLVDEGAEIPDSLFALPTWYVDGKIWMLGNPSLEELKKFLLNDSSTRDDSPDC
jgi:hypothetical protein